VPLADVINNINDPRNGLFLAATVHAYLGKGALAFLKVCFTPFQFNSLLTQLLKTPNPCLEPTDIPTPGENQAVPNTRITLQWILPPDSAVVLNTVPNCRDIRIPLDANRQVLFPTHIVLDYFYGIAALKKWGVHGFAEFLKEYEPFAPAPGQNEEKVAEEITPELVAAQPSKGDIQPAQRLERLKGKNRRREQHDQPDL
jgi:hypothetical protein